MNKEMFLEELRGYLQILEDQEQDDIIEEYAQHIDMKLQKGLREEEAIRDFGPVKELAAEILEAYHVKPDFQKKKAAIKLPGLGGGTAGSGKTFLCVSAGFSGKSCGQLRRASGKDGIGAPENAGIWENGSALEKGMPLESGIPLKKSPGTL